MILEGKLSVVGAMVENGLRSIRGTDFQIRKVINQLHPNTTPWPLTNLDAGQITSGRYY